MISTAFGPAKLVEEVRLQQAADGKKCPHPDHRGATLVQLLEADDGASLVRIAYSTDGPEVRPQGGRQREAPKGARRGPVTFRASDVRRLATALARAPKLKAVIEEIAR